LPRFKNELCIIDKNRSGRKLIFSESIMKNIDEIISSALIFGAIEFGELWGFLGDLFLIPTAYIYIDVNHIFIFFFHNH
jgi:hypothetical protein